LQSRRKCRLCLFSRYGSWSDVAARASFSETLIRWMRDFTIEFSYQSLSHSSRTWPWRSCSAYEVLSDARFAILLLWVCGIYCITLCGHPYMFLCLLCATFISLCVLLNSSFSRFCKWAN
jgi:hypothetical protein